MLNQVTLIGRTTKDAKLSTSANGKEYTFVTLAIDGIPGKDGQKTTDFISVSLFGSSAKFASEYCHKGDILQVTGRLTSRIQEKDGQKTTVLSVTGNRVENLSPRSSNGGTKTVQRCSCSSNLFSASAKFVTLLALTKSSI